MSFYGPTFPNETHYERLLSGRQRFGNRSANMFFVRPARHIACPRRLKYIHDIKTNWIPYVEDSVYEQRPSYKLGLQKLVNTAAIDDETNKTNGLGLYNSTDVWRQELMELAQQVKTSLNPLDDPESMHHHLYHHHHHHHHRTSRLQKHHSKRSTSSSLSNYTEDIDDNQPSKRLLNRRISQPFPRTQTNKLKTSSEKLEQEAATTTTNNNDENQDSGIWLIPILCYVLQIDDVVEAQEWLVNANPTEKRLAMELISRTMQDMQSHDLDLASDVSVPESTATSNTVNSVYWPYKVWQRQEKERHHVMKQSKSTTPSVLPPLTGENSDTCERGTSPIRSFAPAKRSLSINHLPSSVENHSLDRTSTRQTLDRGASTQTHRQSPSPNPESSQTNSKPSSSAMNNSLPTERRSRRGYRVATSLNYPASRLSPVARGKTPLI